MNPQEDPRLPIVALRGLPITVTAMLCKYSQPVSQAHLCNLLCYSDKTMSTALHRLEEFQMLSHSELGWSVTVHITLLGFSLPEWLQAEIEPDGPVDTCPVDTCPVDNPVEKGRKISDSSAPSSTSSIKLTNKKLVKNLLPVLDPKPEPEPEAKKESKAELKTKSPEKIRECRQAALEAGISEPKATKLANMEHVTPELIEHHVERALDEGQTVGCAIFRITNNWEIRKPREQRDQDHEDRQRFVTGKYEAWIHH